jgi:KH domain
MCTLVCMLVCMLVCSGICSVPLRFLTRSTRCGHVLSLAGVRSLVRMIDGDWVELEHPIKKDLHGVLIGRNGETRREIEADTRARLDIPRQNTSKDTIKIIGRKASVQAARSKIDEIIRNLDKVGLQMKSVCWIVSCVHLLSVMGCVCTV